MIVKDKIMSVLSYLLIFILVPLFIPRKSFNLKTHLNSGLVILFLWSLIIFVFQIPFIGVLLGVLMIIACLVFTIWGIVDAVSGKEAKIPGIEKIAVLLQ